MLSDIEGIKLNKAL